ncbi:conserved hypothetical protein [metagenome]|uniref:Galactosyltransferase C-terminal domain-containing protein n=1 Tax=metagenome TaxID=256318 RepID=A0A2P2C7J5_9ZZZZ
MTVAVVTVVHGRHDHLAVQHESLRHQHRAPDHYVVVAMDDAALTVASLPDGPEVHVTHIPGGHDGLPLSAARNTGASHALALGADILIFLDVDCVAGERLVTGYADAVTTQPGVVWSGPVTYLPPPGPTGYCLTSLDALDSPHPARPAPPPGVTCLEADPDLFWSLSFAVHRDAWLSIGGFCEEYVGYGGEDTDYAQLILEAEASLGWAGTPRAYHQHHPSADPPVQHLDAILRNARLFHSRWGRWPMEGWLQAFAQRGLIQMQGETWVRLPASSR